MAIEQSNQLSDFLTGETSDTLIQLYQRLNICKGFATLIAPEKKIAIKYGSGKTSYTSRKGPIVITNEGQDKMDLSIGITIHEAGHKKWSDELFDFMETLHYRTGVDYLINNHFTEDPKTIKYYDKLEPINYSINSILYNLLNFLEDRRIDFRLWKQNPGWRGYYLGLYNKYFWDTKLTSLLKKDVDQVDLNNYLFRIININNKHARLDVLPDLKEILAIMDLRNIANNTVQDIINKAIRILIIVLYNISNPTPKPQQQDQQKNSCNGNSNSEQNEGSDSSNSKNESDDTESSESDDMNKDSNSENQDSKEGNDNDFGIDGFESDLGEKEANDNDFWDVLEKQKDFLSNNIKVKKINKEQGYSLQELEKNSAKIKNTSLLKEKVPVIDMDSSKARTEINYSYRGGVDRQRAVESGKVMGKRLAKSLSILNDTRILETTRKKDGLLNGRLLSESGFNGNIFSHRIVEDAQRSFVYLTIDVSGSISWEGLNNMAKFATMLGVTFAEIGNVHFKFVARWDKNYSVINQTLYDSEKDPIKVLFENCLKLDTSGMTPESVAFDASMDDILKLSQGKNSYFITMSDGGPNGSYRTTKGNTISISKHFDDHIVRIRKEFHKNGITVANYFLTESDRSIEELTERSSNLRRYVTAWGDDFHHIDFNNLNQISKNLNQIMIERKVKF